MCLTDKALFVFASASLLNETSALFVFASASLLNETFVVEVTGTFIAWEWTLLVNPELRLVQIVVKGTRADALKLLLFWPMPIGLSIWWIVRLAQDLIILTLVTIHYSFWWLIDRKQCNQFQLFCSLIIHLISGWLWECWLLGCKAFSLANWKGTGTNDRVIRSLD